MSAPSSSSQHDTRHRKRTLNTDHDQSQRTDEDTDEDNEDHEDDQGKKKWRRVTYQTPFKPMTDMTILRAVVNIVGEHFKNKDKGKKIPLHRVSKLVPMLKHEFVDELQFVSTVMYALHDLHQLHAVDGEWIAQTALNGDTNDPVHCGFGLFEGEDAIRDSLPNIGKDYILRQTSHTEQGHFAGTPITEAFRKRQICQYENILAMSELPKIVKTEVQRELKRLQRQKAQQTPVTVETIQSWKLEDNSRTYAEEERVAEWIYNHIRRPILYEDPKRRKALAYCLKNYDSWVDDFTRYTNTDVAPDTHLVMALTLARFHLLGNSDYCPSEKSLS